MRNNPLQFAVVREDPLIEAELASEQSCDQVLLIASGGCTALTLQTMFPSMSMTLVDPNPSQLELVRAKMEALDTLDETERKARFNVGSDRRDGLCAGGNFESLFRSWREFLFDLVLPPAEMHRLFTEPGALSRVNEQLFECTYWSVSFDLFFSGSLLEAMFGPDATQHAAPGSYPRYFQDQIERGLRDPDAERNFFLHHVLLGHYIDRVDSLPVYLTQPPAPWKIELVQSTVEEVGDLDRFDMISFSNIFDWMSSERVERLASRIAEETRPGMTIVYRQLNNARNFEAAFGPRFEFSAELGERLLAMDRSRFYSSIHVGKKRS